MKKNYISIPAFCAILFFGATAATAQFTIKIPKIKIEKPKSDQPKPSDNPTTDVTASRETSPKVRDSKQVYGFFPVPSVPTIMKDTVYVQTDTVNTYWKMPNAKKYTSWVPKVRFDIFYDWNKPVSYKAEYYNPDNSLWFSEPMESGNRSADRTITFQSHRSSTPKMLETKASIATGIYSFKIIKDTGETFYQGKFKVGKFLPPYSEKNEFDFFVEHDWLLPHGFIGFHYAYFDSDENIGGYKVIASVWLKGKVERSDLEARVFYQNRQIASTADKNNKGISEGSVSDSGERASQFGHFSADLYHWKLWDFTFGNLLYDNGGGFNKDYHPNATYADKNPGEYTIKIFHKGVQIRELKFTVNPDGKLNDGGFASQIYLIDHKILVPVKVIGTTEKWNATAWKTDAFYGNPLAGFEIR